MSPPSPSLLHTGKESKLLVYILHLLTPLQYSLQHSLLHLTTYNDAIRHIDDERVVKREEEKEERKTEVAVG